MKYMSARSDKKNRYSKFAPMTWDCSSAVHSGALSSISFEILQHILPQIVPAKRSSAIAVTGTMEYWK